MNASTEAGGPGAGPASLRLPGIVLGVGLGGFVDGILLHQLLQWHHMLTSTDDDNIGVKYYPANSVSGLEMNTVWDGLFHTVCWIAVLTGLAVLYSRVTHRRRRVWTSPMLWGWALTGWGLFNIVEGLVDHHILAIHHVRSGAGQVWWDVGFLVLGVVLVAAGWALRRTASPFGPGPAGPGTTDPGTAGPGTAGPGTGPGTNGAGTAGPATGGRARSGDGS